MLNLNKLFPRLSIRNKLAIGFTVVALVPLGAVTAVGVRDTIGIIRHGAASTLARDLEMAESETARALAAAQGHVDFFARVLLAEMFSAAPPRGDDLEAVAREVSRQVAAEPTLWRVHLFSSEGEPLLSVDASGPIGTDGRTERSAPYYAWRAQQLAPGRVLIVPVEVRAPSDLGAVTTVAALAIIQGIRAPDGGLQGVVVGEALASRTFEGLESATPGYAGTTALVDSSGLFLYHSERKRDWARLLAVRNDETLRSDYPTLVATQMLSGSEGVAEVDGELLSYRPLRLGERATDGLTIYRAVPVARLRAPVRAFVTRVAVLGVVAVVLVLLAAVLAADQFTRPILTMREATHRIAANDEDVSLSVDTNDEMEDLAADLLMMSHTITAQRSHLRELLSEQGRALERTRAALADVVDHSADAIVMTDDAGAVTAWNQGATRLFGYDAPEAVGTGVEELIGRRGPGVERELAYLSRELALHGEVVNYDTERMTRERTPVPVSLTLTRITGAEGSPAGFSHILRDNRLRAQLDDQLRRSERLAAVSVLAAGLAHEINNPLAIISNRIECMQRDVHRAGNADGLGADLDVLANHVSRLASVTGGLLRFAREDDGNEADLEVGQVAHRVAHLLERTIVQRQLRLDTAIAEGLPLVRANERAIETVVVNLLLNAADATPPGGHVALQVTALPDEDGVCLSVRDSGTGVPAPLRERIFEPFFTTKPAGRGTGLGLTVCRSIIERHGGRLELVSLEGPGARFDVTLLRDPARFTWTPRAS